MTYEQSESISEIAPALSVAQQAVSGAPKNSTNPHFRSDYADITSVRAAALPALKLAGLSLTQWPVGDGTSIGMTTQLTHDESGEWMRSTFHVRPDKPGPQPAGAVLTYLRRYSMAAVLGIPQVDDDGNGGHTWEHEISLRSHELKMKVTDALNKANSPERLAACVRRLGEIKGDLRPDDYRQLRRRAQEIGEALESEAMEDTDEGAT